jgi:molybdopterin converting factor subunit 1
VDVRVLYFATLRDLAGAKEEQVGVPDGSTVADLKALLIQKHPDLARAQTSMLVSINREFAFDEDTLHDGDEVAIFPPVSGGTPEPAPTAISITHDPLDLNTTLEALVLPTTGAVCIFTGTVRGQTERGTQRKTKYLEYEAYTSMAEAKLRQVADEIRARWPDVEGIALVQRVGHLDAGIPSVLIACAASHRDTGVFDAARYGIDRLKEIVPIWKKEVSLDGEVWIEGDYTPDEGDRRS